MDTQNPEILNLMASYKRFKRKEAFRRKMKLIEIRRARSPENRAMRSKFEQQLRDRIAEEHRKLRDGFGSGDRVVSLLAAHDAALAEWHRTGAILLASEVDGSDKLTISRNRGVNSAKYTVLKVARDALSAYQEKEQRMRQLAERLEKLTGEPVLGLYLYAEGEKGEVSRTEWGRGRESRPATSFRAYAIQRMGAGRF